MASTLYIADNTNTQYSLQVDVTGNYTVYIPPGKTGTWSWIVEKYGSQRQTGTFNVNTSFSPTISFVTDVYISQTTRATVAAYTSFSTLDQLYDYAAYMRTQLPQYLLATKNGQILDFGSTNIVVNTAAASVWNYNATTNTLTIKATALGYGNNFNAIKTTGTFTISANTTVSAIYLSNLGVSQNVELRNIPAGAYVAIYDAAKNIKQYWANTTAGTYTYYIPPGVSETWTWAMEYYGKNRNESTFPTDVGGIIYFVPDDVADIGITQTSLSTVQAYTSITTLDQLYDASAAYRTTQAGIVIGNLMTKSSGTLDLGSVSLVANATASSLFSATSSVITIKSPTLSYGTKFNQLLTLGTITASNGASYALSAIDSTGTNTLLTISGVLSGVLVKLVSGSTVLASGTSTGSSVVLKYFLAPGTTSTNASIYAEKATGNANGYNLFTGAVILNQALTSSLINMTPDPFYGRSAGASDRANVSITWNSSTGVPTITLSADTDIKTIYDMVLESHATVSNLTYYRPTTSDGNIYQFGYANFNGAGKITGTTQFYSMGSVAVKYDLILNSYNTVNFPVNSLVKIIKNDGTVLSAFGVNAVGKVELNLPSNTDYRVFIKTTGYAPKEVSINSGTGKVVTITPVVQTSYSATTDISTLTPLVRLTKPSSTLLNVYLGNMSALPLQVAALVDYIQQQEAYADVALAVENGSILYINDTNQITPVKANVNLLRETTLATNQSVMWQTFFSTGSLSYPDFNFTPADLNQLFVNSYSSAVGQVVLMDSQVATIATTAVNQLLNTVLSNGKTVKANINEIDILTNIISTEVQKSS